MLPILDRLARLQEASHDRLVGVRALFLYPLNALINSQRDRLRAWTHAFEGNVSFCLYNGNTPETVPSRMQSEHPNEALSRTILRASPPPILVTNASMLEYMLVRTIDAPILEQSQGTLEWVVLDEAHTYIGSQAAEAALLIRRVLFAFGVRPENVRFVATSATIGDPEGEGGLNLRRFLADVAGVPLERVHLVAGARDIPSLDAFPIRNDDSLADLSRIDPELVASGARYHALCQNQAARRIRDQFVGGGRSNVARLSEICRQIFHPKDTFTLEDQHHALGWLDLLTGTREVPDDAPQDGETFLPLRSHLFHQTMSGLWACCDPDCPEKKEAALDAPGWPFGRIYLVPRKHCRCGSPVYEAVSCDDCGQVYLMAGDHNGTLVHHLTRRVLDDFELEVESDGGGESGDDGDDDDESDTRHQVLVTNVPFPHTERVGVERTSRHITLPSGEDVVILNILDSFNGRLDCPACTGAPRRGEALFQYFRLGAPFLIGNILPTLLEFAPDGDNPASHPYRGRRLLSFNDSRQGSARMATKLQLDAERNRVRGLVYHLALQHCQTGDPKRIAQLKQQIGVLETLRESNSAIDTVIGQMREELLGLSLPKPIPYQDLANRLSDQTQDITRMFASYKRNAPEEFGSHAELARMFLVREFGRRPKRLNNLETMGLVSVAYPSLGQLRELPPAVRQYTDLTLDQWRDFLKIALDLYVRGGGMLQYPSGWKNWLGQRFPIKYLVPRDQSNVASNQKRWPRVRRARGRSTLVRLLAYVLHRDPDLPRDEDILDSILLDAWNDLTNTTHALRIESSGHILPLTELAFMPMSKAWICPVTRRFLDTTLRGVTPYLPRLATPAKAVCQAIQIPLYSEPFGGTADDLERVRRGRAWIASQEMLAPLRSHGHWGDLNDRVIELAPYFTAAEHSAQQSSTVLNRYEHNFKSGDLNLLSCSTTMDMGIDIGGISEVSMNNVPPHPANYLQRAGRAGRRRESRSLAMTLCKSNPHDQSVFANTRWAFDADLPAPRVSLDSPIIVQRHIQSMLLSWFLPLALRDSGMEQIKLTCGAFFTGDPALSARFATWCDAFPDRNSEQLADGVRMLLRHTCLEGRPLREIGQLAATSIQAISRNWNQERRNLDEELKRLLAGGHSSPASRAVELHLARMDNEYLLRELATRGFLPSYGFPTDIASFDNLTRRQFLRNREQRDEGRDDNLMRRRELPSRDLMTALREYAPGAEVVMDGLVYRSSGVTLNWHIPAAQEDVHEIQELRFAWRCQSCGASGSSRSLEGAGRCADCGSEVAAGNRMEFLVPAGFAVDFYQEPTNDITIQHFVPVEKPWINAHGEWQDLPFNQRGRFRVCTDGHVFHHSRGINSTGYALCLECGRAEPMTPSDPPGVPGAPGKMPKVFEDPHPRLRRADGQTGICRGSDDPWRIKQGLTLGHETTTDILEIQIKTVAGAWLFDRVVAQTLAVALRDALADLIGVQATELGCDIKQAVTPERVVCYSILIYDHYAAGYSSGATNSIAELFRRAQQRLACPANCDSACPACILDFDQRFDFDLLDRLAALDVLNDEWLA